jgi:hypothetical protein
MSEALLWSPRGSRRLQRLAGHDDNDRDRRILERKAHLAVITDHRNFDEITIDYRSVIDAKSSRRSPLEARPPLPDQEVLVDPKPVDWFRDWDAWDILVAFGVLLLLVGVLVPLVSSRKEAAIAAPLGAAAIGFGAYRSRQKNNPPA